jgi:hypothetical protein
LRLNRSTTEPEDETARQEGSTKLCHVGISLPPPSTIMWACGWRVNGHARAGFDPER